MSVDRRHGIAWGLLFLAVLGIIVFRAPEMILLPSLPFDEGAKVFAHFYEHREAAEILRFKSGYLPLIGNLIGYLAVRFPTRAVPYALVSSAVLISALSYSLFFAPYFRRWIPSDLGRAMICLAFAFAPVSDCLLVTISDYSLWNLLVILILLMVWQPPVQPGWRWVHGVAVNLLVWSHPLSLIVAPLVLWRAINNKTDQTYYRVVLFNLVVHQIFGVSGILTTHGLWDHGTGVPIDAGITTKLRDASAWTLQIVTATAFRAAFGLPSFASAVQEKSALPIVWIAALIGAAFWCGIKIPRIRSLLVALAYLVVTVTFLSCFLRHEDVHDAPIYFIQYSPRYIYIQSLCCLLLFGTLLISGWEIAWSHVGAGKMAIRCARLSVVPLAAFVCYYCFLNTQFGYYFVFRAQRAGPYYDPDPQNGLIVREFFDKLAKEERIRGSHRQIQLTAQKANDWPIVIDTTVSYPSPHLRLSHRARVLALALFLVAIAYITRSSWIPWVRVRVKRNERKSISN